MSAKSLSLESKTEFRENANDATVSSSEEIEAISSEVQKLSGPNDSLMGFPDLGVFNFICDRPFFGRYPMPGFVWAVEEWRKELLDSMTHENPRLVLKREVVSNLAASIQLTQELMPEVLSYVDQNYVLAGSPSHFQIYAPKESS